MHSFPMPKVYSYTRFSTPEQAKGDSARRQQEAALRWATRRGLSLDESLTINDLGVSAYRGTNAAEGGGLGAFLEAVKSNLVEPGSFLAVESLDRISRMTPRKAQRLMDDIVDAGITIVTLNDEQEYSAERLDNDPTALLIALMVSWRAHDESKTKGRRVAAAWAEKRRKVRTGEAAMLTRRAPAWLREDNGRLVPDPSKAEVVRRIYRLTIDGWGEHRIAGQLNREGAPPLGSGKLWHRSSVAKVLRNRAVLGEMTPGRLEHRDGRKRRVLEEPIPGAFPAIITEAEWAAVRTLKDGLAPAVRGRGASKPLANAFAGLARCPDCGGSMIRVNKGSGGKAGKPKLVCARAKAGAGCRYVSVPLEPLHEALYERWERLVTDVPAGQGRQGELDRRHSALVHNIAGTEDHFQDLAEALEAAPSAAGARRLAELERQIETMKSELAAVDEQRRLTDGGLIRERAYALADLMRAEGGGAGNLEAVNARLRSLFAGVTVDYVAGRLHFQWRQGGTSSVPYRYDWTEAAAPAAN